MMTEEILSSDNALWWSPDGTYLCYAVFNDTQVRRFTYMEYGEYDSAYTDSRPIAYPKVILGLPIIF